MKNQTYQPRLYRQWVNSPGLNKIHVVEKESDILILCDYPFEEEFIRKRIINYRNQIEDYIKKDKSFLTSLQPIKVAKDAPSIVKDMAKAGRLADVGPMASVAGAISQYLAQDLDRCGELIIENGGDVFIKSKTKRRIGIFAGGSTLSSKIAIEIEAHQTPLGVCASSGTVGHSLSFGNTDATVVISRSCIIADSFATALGNVVKTRSDIKKAIEQAKSNKYIEGLLIIIQDVLSVWGNFKIIGNKK